MLKLRVSQNSMEYWHDAALDARVSLTLDHSLHVKNGLFVHYRVLIDHDHVDFLQLANSAEKALYVTLRQIGLEFEENSIS